MSSNGVTDWERYTNTLIDLTLKDANIKFESQNARDETKKLSPALEKAWLERFGEIPEEFKHLQSRQLSEKLEKSLKDAQKRREESLRGMGYKVPIELSRSELEEKWRERYGYVPKIPEDDDE